MNKRCQSHSVYTSKEKTNVINKQQPHVNIASKILTKKLYLQGFGGSYKPAAAVRSPFHRLRIVIENIPRQQSYQLNIRGPHDNKFNLLAYLLVLSACTYNKTQLFTSHFLVFTLLYTLRVVVCTCNLVDVQSHVIPGYYNRIHSPSNFKWYTFIPSKPHETNPEYGRETPQRLFKEIQYNSSTATHGNTHLILMFNICFCS